ncbi:hypothetical protein GON03_07910 [Nocardioides sp. MAH-18]|uniref:Nucleotidyltransferase family protein n=1 Tax=Nocardioides agri TaxID=2682843 RepID=A0A6L6XPA7_9ACTN|nr:hypothetical protein [Nocardioides sp. MAH-18]
MPEADTGGHAQHLPPHRAGDGLAEEPLELALDGGRRSRERRARRQGDDRQQRRVEHRAVDRVDDPVQHPLDGDHLGRQGSSGQELDGDQRDEDPPSGGPDQGQAAAHEGAEPARGPAARPRGDLERERVRWLDPAAHRVTPSRRGPSARPVSFSRDRPPSGPVGLAWRWLADPVGKDSGDAVVDRTIRRAVDAACVDVCRGRAPDLPRSVDVGGELVRAVRFHRIAPLAHVALRDARPDLAALLREDRDHALNQHVRVTASLAAIASTLAGTPWLVVKGPVLSESLHPVAGLRSYNDLDVLVAPADVRHAGERLLDSGWHVLATSDDLLNGEVAGELELGRAGGAVVDLHWSLVLSETLRGRFNAPTSELIERSVPLMVGPVEVRTLDPVDTLVHLCHHAALSGAVRLLHLLDVDQAARRVDDWDEVVRRARSWGAGPQVWLVLGRAERVLGTPVPSDLGRRLGLSRNFGRLMAAVDSVLPVPAVRREASWPRLVARAARPSASATAWTAMRNAFLGALNRARRAPTAAAVGPAGRRDVATWFAEVERVSRRPAAQQ